MRETQGLTIGCDGVIHPALFGVYGGERPQGCHASSPVDSDRTDRQRALEEFPRTLAVTQSVVVHSNSVEAKSLIARGLNLSGERERKIIEAQRLVELA